MASVTLNQELDSSFLKGLRLLHSTEPDAEEQLQNLWKQSIVEKYGSERTPISILHKITVPVALKRENQDTTSDAPIDVKRPKLESSLFSKPSSSASPQRPVAAADAESNHSSSNDDSDNESPLEILNSEGNCMKCKTSTSSANDKLVECVDCQKHYHQMCHFPPITDMDLSDPRFVWYCASCDQNITTTTVEKTKTSSSSTAGATKSTSSSKGAASTTKSGRVYSTNNNKSSSASSSSKTRDTNSKDSSKSSEKKGHMMKKRSSVKKPEKKKSSK